MTPGLVMVCDVDLDVPDGARTHTVEVARGFARCGLSVDLVARGPDPGIPGVRFHSASGDERQRATRLGTLSLVALTALWRRRGGVRRLYVRHKWSTMPAAVAGHLLGYRVVSEVDDVPYGPTFEGDISWCADHMKRLMTRLMGRVSRGVVAGTVEARDLLTREFGVPAARITVVPIGVDVDYFRPGERGDAIRRAGLDPARRYALFIGNFAPWVDFDTLLEAFARIARARPDVTLLLVGDGAERERIEQIIRDRQISASVVLTGFIRDRERIRDLLSAADVLLASHRGEHLDRIGMNATKIAEYLAAGRPIVAKDVARLREMLQAPGAGIVASDGEQMATAILTALDPQQGKVMGDRARLEAVTRYSWDATVQRTLPLFDQPV